MNVTEVEQLEGPPLKRRRNLPPHLHNSGFAMHDKRLKDILPEPVPPIPLPVPPIPLPVPPIPLPDPALIHLPEDNEGPADTNFRGSDPHDPPIDMDRYIETPSNVFGLFRRYYGSSKLPVHDPEYYDDICNVSDIPITDAPSLPSAPLPTPPSSSFHPYPNGSSFMLGDWYWNGGAQKSQDDLKRLLSILNDSAFSLDDIRKTNWTQINRHLAINEWDEGEWADEDAGWRRQPVTIQVPFHRFTANPGLVIIWQQTFTIDHFCLLLKTS
ncbi:hypothetical protein Hypma_014642 [Hypsizygus marmoreus]|uniref:Uncharacterized protein n=1 Tax=Hypsizygus marmoreus TaxID=39966 RepID=A0A369J9D8_HYPMA|nr:hypothetical protein Hypma_014642 [Hypsizygus marmoreus]